MATFAVTNLNDSGAGSLRQAILDANVDPGADVITFAPGLAGGTIRLTQGSALYVTQEATIDGDINNDGRPDITVDGQYAASRFGITSVFSVTTSAAVNLEGLVITGASGGQGVRGGNVNLTIENSIITGNEGPYAGSGVGVSSGALTITDSTISGNLSISRGGGVFIGSGTLDISGSTISGNTGGEGGGVGLNNAILHLTNSTIHGNHASNFGGALRASAGTIYLLNSTVTSNSSGDGYGGLSLVTGTLHVTNSLVLGNYGPGNMDDVAAPTIVDTASIIGGVPADIFAATIGGTGGGVLADNGGPVKTVALKANAANPALDASGAGATANDARGEAALDIFGLGNELTNFRDLGAFELVAGVETPSLVVTILTDTVDPFDGETSLREAIAFANDPNANGGSGDADNDGFDNDTITFAPALAAGGTITLVGGQLAITDEVTIDNGTTPDIIIDAGGLSRVIDTSADTALKGLTITGGLTTGSLENGAGIRASADLDVQDSLVTRNRTEGLFSSGAGIALENGTLTVSNSTISYNSIGGGSSRGAGISNSSGNTTLTGTTIHGNTSVGSTGTNSKGAGFFGVDGDLTLIGSTVSNNSTSGTIAYGAGLYSIRGTIKLINSTVSGNTTTGQKAVGAGIYNYEGNTVLINSTITGNTTSGSEAFGGGLYTDKGTITLSNSIIIGNSTTYSGLGDDEFKGALVENGPNIIGGIDPATPTDVFDALAPNGGGLLANNGGPVMTVALKASATNPALDKGNGASVSPDARGLATFDFTTIANTNGNARDLGAFELQLSEAETRSLVVTITDDIVNPFDNETSLREAIAFANDPTANGGSGDADGVNGAVDTITFAGGVGEVFEGGGTASVTNGQLVITNDVIIDGDVDADGSPDVTIDAFANSRVFETSAATTFKGLIIVGGYTTGDDEDGGAILATGTGDLVIQDSLVHFNGTSGDFSQGGAINAVDANVIVNNSTISNNATHARYSYGGAIYTVSGDVTVTNSTISGNSTAGQNSSGGAIYSTAGAVSLTNSTLSGNSTSGQSSSGGGIFSYAGGVTLTDSTVSGNSTAGTGSNGGGIGTAADVTLTNSTVSGNSTSGPDSRGGGVYGGGNVTLINSTLSGNSTSGSNSMGGGAVGGAVYLTNSTVTGNSTAGSSSVAGGIAAQFGDFNTRNSIVLGNVTNYMGVGNDEFSGTLIESGPNIIGGIDPYTAGDIFAQTAQVIDGLNNPTGVQAGALGDYGGPIQTVALKIDATNPALDAGNDTFAPTLDARGETRFDQSGIANNGLNISDLGAFELIEQVNRNPVALDDVLATLEDVALVIQPSTLLGNDTDPDGDTLQIVAVSNATNGTVVLNPDGTITFTPIGNFFGTASFDYAISDDDGETDTATVSITVAPVPDAPTLPSTNSVFTLEDTPSGVVNVAALDPDGDAITIGIKPGAAPAKGSVVFGTNTFVYTPFADLNGTDSFVILVTDSTGLSSEQLVSVLIEPVQDAPVAVDDTVMAIEDMPREILASSLLANDFDVDGDPLAIGAVLNPVHGSVAFDGTKVVFTPDAGFTGTASFDYRIFDGKAGIDVATVTLEVVPLEEAPNLDPEVDGTQEVCTLVGRTAAITVVAIDPDGDPLSWSAGTPAHGTVAGGTDGSFVYTPETGFAGTDSFTVTVLDGEGGSAVQLVTVKVIDTAYDAQWSLVTDSGFTGAIGGTGDVFGTAGSEDITVLDLAGTVVFDPSFGTGDVVRLSGDAEDWKVTVSGSNAVFTDGDTLVILPGRPDGIAIAFADGVRNLAIDGGTMEIGGQAITEAFSVISAPGDGTPVPSGADPAASGDLLFNSGGSASVAGKLSIFGTAGSETVTVLSGTVDFDPSFNGASGNVDTVLFDDPAGDFTVQLAGSNVVLAGTDTTATIPVGPDGTALNFAGDTALLSYAIATDTVTIAAQEITATASPLSFA